MAPAISRCSAAASIAPKATVGRSRGGTKTEGIETSSGREHRLPLQRLRRCLAVAAAILDGKPPGVGKSAAQRDVDDLGADGPLQQFTPRLFEIDVAQHGARRLAEKERNCRCSVRPETPATAASSFTLQPCPTFACIASSARRTLRGSGDDVDPLFWLAIISKTPRPPWMCLAWGEKVHHPDSRGAIWINACRSTS